MIPAWRVLWDNAREEWLEESNPTKDQYLRVCEWVWESIAAGPPVAVVSPTDPSMRMAAVEGAQTDALFVVWPAQMYPLPTMYVMKLSQQ